MRANSGILILSLALAVCVAGCTPKKGDLSPDNPLSPPRIAPNSMDLDVFFITLPEQTAETTFASVWRDADAQQITPEIRQRQLANGLRAAVLGWRLPPEIQHLIEERSQPLTGGHAQTAETSLPGNIMAPADLEKMERISIRRVPLPPSKRTEIVVSREFDSFPLLLVEDGQVSGGAKENAQGVLGLRAKPVAGGKVKLEIDPELQYGQSEQKYNNSITGVWKLTHSKQKVSLEMLAFSCELSPGEFVAIGSASGRPGSIGDRFFEDNSMPEPRRKLLLIRLARSPGSELFGGLNKD
ncbi:MAG: hypothetical protein MPJ50_03205 [Pirellulales bacterium]|nr:hypothetical protein [Pirellulales bacterium]